MTPGKQEYIGSIREYDIFVTIYWGNPLYRIRSAHVSASMSYCKSTGEWGYSVHDIGSDVVDFIKTHHLLSQ